MYVSICAHIPQLKFIDCFRARTFLLKAVHLKLLCNLDRQKFFVLVGIKYSHNIFKPIYVVYIYIYTYIYITNLYYTYLPALQIFIF